MTAYYNEIDPWCCKVLRKNIAAGNLPAGDVDDRDIRDVRTSDLYGYDQIHLFAGIGGIPYGLRLAGIPDNYRIITGGFPCVDISKAGKGKGIEGERSGLWKDFYRLIRGLRPRRVLVENVAQLLTRGVDTVLGDLAKIGFDAEWSLLSACSVGASHTRERLFIVAYPNRYVSQWHQTFSSGLAEAQSLSPVDREKSYRAEWPPRADDTARGRFADGLAAVAGDREYPRWQTQPHLNRSDDGISNRLDEARLKGLGNAVVPQVIELIGRGLLAMEAQP